MLGVADLNGKRLSASASEYGEGMEGDREEIDNAGAATKKSKEAEKMS